MTETRRQYEPPLTDWEKELLAPRTIRIGGARNIPADTSAYSIDVPLVDAIAAVQSAGYLVYEIGELPEVTQDGNGKPKLPRQWGEQKYGRTSDQSQIELFYEEAFGKLALARWWEKEAERRSKRIEALRTDIEEIEFDDSPQLALLAQTLVERGWRRG